MRAVLRTAVASATLALVASALPALAQSPAVAPAAAAAGAEWSGDLPAHFDGITLSAAQKQRIARLQKDYHARMDAVRDSAKAAGAAAGDPVVAKRVAALMTEEHAAFRALLDEAGQRRFDANMARMHQSAGHGGGHGAAKADSTAAHGAGHGSGHAGHGAGRPPRR